MKPLTLETRGKSLWQRFYVILPAHVESKYSFNGGKTIVRFILIYYIYVNDVLSKQPAYVSLVLL